MVVAMRAFAQYNEPGVPVVQSKNTEGMLALALPPTQCFRSKVGNSSDWAHTLGCKKAAVEKSN